jgi:hypothetical protein
LSPSLRATKEATVAATKIEAELALTIQAHANTNVFASQASVKAVLLIKEETPTPARGQVVGASLKSSASSAAARPPLSPWSPTALMETLYVV